MEGSRDFETGVYYQLEVFRVRKSPCVAHISQQNLVKDLGRSRQGLLHTVFWVKNWEYVVSLIGCKHGILAMEGDL